MNTVLSDVQGWVGNAQTNVLYKAFALVAILTLLALMPSTSKFAVGAAWLILIVLLIQGG